MVSHRIRARVTFKPLQHGREGGIALALGQHLQTVVVVSHILLVDAQHRQQHVEQIAYVRVTSESETQTERERVEVLMLRMIDRLGAKTQLCINIHSAVGKHRS